LALEGADAAHRRAVRRHCRTCADCDGLRRERENADAAFAAEIDGMLATTDVPDKLYASIRRRLGGDAEVAGVPRQTDFTRALRYWLPKFGYAALSLAVAILLTVCGATERVGASALTLKDMVMTQNAMELMLP